MKKSIISIITIGIFLSGCNEETPKENVVKETTIETVQVKEPTIEEKKEEIKESLNVIAKETQNIMSKTTDLLKDSTQDLQDEAEQLKEVATKNIEKTTKELSKTSNELLSKAKTTMNTLGEKSIQKGKKLYGTCASCHGQKGEKSALNKSKIIKGWTKTQLEDAMTGYKNGSYGGAMKGIMIGQLSNKSDEDIKALASYIETLK